MRAFVTDVQGKVWELPPARKWEMEYGIGTPCDSFFLTVPWKNTMETKGKDWVSFHAEHEGERVFTGVVDECEVSLSDRGCVLELSGRGMAALLLDNEALGQDYQLATLEDILRNHVTPYGIVAADRPALPCVPRFRVDVGSSEWTVLEKFLRAAGGGQPRFDALGRLILSRWTQTDCLHIGTDTQVVRLCRRDKRYGALSEVLVRDRFSGTVQRETHKEFLEAGGRARRVLTMPGRAGYAEMQAAGQEQLARSCRELEELEVTLPAPFWAMPGQPVCLEGRGDFDGTYCAVKSTVGADESGYWTRLTLRPRENM